MLLFLFFFCFCLKEHGVVWRCWFPDVSLKWCAIPVSCLLRNEGRGTYLITDHFHFQKTLCHPCDSHSFDSICNQHFMKFTILNLRQKLIKFMCSLIALQKWNESNYTCPYLSSAYSRIIFEGLLKMYVLLWKALFPVSPSGTLLCVEVLNLL